MTHYCGDNRVDEVDQLSELIKIWHEKGYKQGLCAAKSEIAQLKQDDPITSYSEALDKLDTRLANIINKSEGTK